MKWLKVFCQVLLIDIVLLGAMAPAQAAEVELRVLVIANGDYANQDSNLVDQSRVVMENLLNSLGVPYEVINACGETGITTVQFQNGSRGRFNGIILTDAATALPGGNGVTCLDGTGFTFLHQYERTFGVHEAVVSGYPTTNASLDLDYGMDTSTVTATLNTINGLWQPPAGGTEIFEYVNTGAANLLTIEGYTYTAVPRNDGSSPTVVPLLVDSQNQTHTIVSKLTYQYPDGSQRQVLLCTASNATYLFHSSVLAYEFLNFATSGLFIGARHVYLETHIDDLFNNDDLWNPATNSNWPEGTIDSPYRLSATEFANVAYAQGNIQKHQVATNFKIDLPFNGILATSKDPLTTAVRLLASNFGFINHTYSHRLLDTGFADYSAVYSEINKNATVWKNLRLPGYQYASSELLTGEYSGLSDVANGIAFPNGFNPALGQACSALGVRMLLSNSSLDNQKTIQQVTGYNIVLMPRYPTNLFYNASTPDEDASEYNNIFYDPTGSDPAKIGPCPPPVAGMRCGKQTYPQIIAAEADITMQQMLSYTPFPHMFHQSNLHTYDGDGHIMLIDWLDAVLTKYEGLIKLPIVSLRVHDLDTLAWQIVTARQAVPSGWLDTATRKVSLTGLSAATVEVTGLAGGTLYGGQLIRKVPVSPTSATTTYDIDPALSQ